MCTAVKAAKNCGPEGEELVGIYCKCIKETEERRRGKGQTQRVG